MRTPAGALLLAAALVAGCAPDGTAPAEPPAAPIMWRLDLIDRCFAPDTLDEILACLDAEKDPWARDQAATIRSKSPTACAVALRNLQIFEDEHLVERAERMGRRLNDGLARLLEMPNVGEVRGLGLMAAVEVVPDKASRGPFDPKLGVGPKLARAMPM